MAESAAPLAPKDGREKCDVLIVGSGFAGTILARVLARQGRDVILVERGRHPRFALGESSTPLAALSLERLAAATGLEDLAHLAAYGRWHRHLPHLRRGLKRGFTFYQHRRGKAFRNGEANENRLLVAASPSQAAADCHWLRQDVDHHLVMRAEAEGVRYRDRTRLHGFDPSSKGVVATGEGPRGSCVFEASFLVDASGPGGFLATFLPIAPVTGAAAAPSTSLLWGHFRGVHDFPAQALEKGCQLPPGPYPDSTAAVHHILEDGWLYLLPFDHGVVSAGLLQRPGTRGAAGFGMHSRRNLEDWRRALSPWPSLQQLFVAAEAAEPVGFFPRIGYRLERSCGERWLLLPHGFAFFDPLFSTGMAWSLLAVERVADLFSRSGAEPSRHGLERYSELLDREADQIADLVEASWGCFGHFDALRAIATLYFAAVSFQELRQRLVDPAPGRPWAWDGFLGATDPPSRAMVQEGRRPSGGAGEASSGGGWGGGVGRFGAMGRRGHRQPKRGRPGGSPPPTPLPGGLGGSPATKLLVGPAEKVARGSPGSAAGSVM